MKNMATLAWIAAIAVAALGLFHVKYQVQRLEDDLTNVQRDIQGHQEAIHVLKAEWSFLNQPARIAALAARHLGLGPLGAGQFASIDSLPLRQGADPTGATATPGVTATSAEAGQ